MKTWKKVGVIAMLSLTTVIAMAAVEDEGYNKAAAYLRLRSASSVESLSSSHLGELRDRPQQFEGKLIELGEFNPPNPIPYDYSADNYCVTKETSLRGRTLLGLSHCGVGVDIEVVLPEGKSDRDLNFDAQAGRVSLLCRLVKIGNRLLPEVLIGLNDADTRHYLNFYWEREAQQKKGEERVKQEQSRRQREVADVKYRRDLQRRQWESDAPRRAFLAKWRIKTWTTPPACLLGSWRGDYGIPAVFNRGGTGVFMDCRPKSGIQLAPSSSSGRWRAAGNRLEWQQGGVVRARMRWTLSDDRKTLVLTLLDQIGREGATISLNRR